MCGQQLATPGHAHRVTGPSVTSTIGYMGENTGRSTNALAAARSVLARDLLRPRMQALTALVKAADRAADPDSIRQQAQDAADKVIEEARTEAREVMAAARRRRQELNDQAQRQARELRRQAERDIKEAVELWRTAYQAACSAGWTASQLAEARQVPPPSARSYRSATGPATRRAHSSRTSSRSVPGLTKQDDRTVDAAEVTEPAKREAS